MDYREEKELHCPPVLLLEMEEVISIFLHLPKFLLLALEINDKSQCASPRSLASRGGWICRGDSFMCEGFSVIWFKVYRSVIHVIEK